MYINVDADGKVVISDGGTLEEGNSKEQDDTNMVHH